MALRLALDMDDVLADWSGRVLEWWNQDHPGQSLTRESITTYKVEDHLGPEGKYFVRSVCRHPMFYRSLDPVPGAIEGVRSLLSAGHDVVVATAAPKWAADSYSAKVDWMREHMPFLPLENLIAISRKGLLRADVLLDDNPAHIEAFATAGGLPVVMDRPWNRGVDLWAPRVYGWEEFVDRLESGIWTLRWWDDRPGAPDRGA